MAAPRKDNVREKIMEATECLLETQSMDSISLASIASTAGISKGTLYYYYKAKEDILIDLVNQHLDQRKKDLFDWVDNKDKDTSLHRLVMYFLECGSEEPMDRIHVIYNGCLGNDALRNMIISRYKEFQSVIAAKIAERLDGPSAETLAWQLVLLMDGIVIQSALKTPDFDKEAFIQGMTQLTQELLEKEEK